MELLTITHTDFVLTIECPKFDDIWKKAMRNIGEPKLLSRYAWTEGVVSVERKSNGEPQPLQNGEYAPAIFFDNADYPLWVEFSANVKDAQFDSEIQEVSDKFSFRRGILAGFLNYGNEIGRSEINIRYTTKENEVRRFTFSFEVLSTKLDYHEHWRSILEDIEAEYRMLSLDYLRRTFHGFSPDINGEKPDLIWWCIFDSEQEKFIKACKGIIERPRHRLHGYESNRRADRLTVIPQKIENELAEHREDGNHLYRVEEQLQTNDTLENRFLKFALKKITKKYEELKGEIEELKTISQTKKDDMAETLKTLKGLEHNSFFRTVGNFKGMSQESLVLQKATGYSQVYRTWNLLRRGYSLYDGLFRLQTKDIATLYEIWCFIEVSHIVKEQLQDAEVENCSRIELNGNFTWELGKGEHSRILFKKGDVQLAELVYNPKNTDNANDNAGLKDLVSPTVPQKPDIVLQLTKNDLREGMKMTYLFDAKYRIDSRTPDGVDTPPDDAINQMHRYRDAIYFKEYDANLNREALKKEVIGGYILFPGDGDPAKVAVSKFYETIRQVNIGAFPLRPKDTENRRLLAQFIEQLITTKSHETIAHVIPQKGAFVEVGNRVLIGLVGDNSRGNAAQSKFLDGTATLYYTGSHFPTTIALQNLHFFMPYLTGKGIRDVYEITRVRTISAKEAKQLDGTKGKNDIRLAFDLRFARHQFTDYQMINTSRMANYTFIDTTFEEVEGYLV